MVDRCLILFRVHGAGIQKYGAGNWKEISAFMDSDKKEKKLDEHYWQLYMGRHGVCLPVDYSIDNLATTRATANLFPDPPVKDEDTREENISPSDLYRIPVVPGYERGQNVERDVLPNHPMPSVAAATASSGTGRGRQVQSAPQPPATDLPGYMPLREDFETEYENDAEQFLADMEFSPEDHPSEVELKLQVIRIYNHKLEEREKRKRFVLERGLVDIKKHQQEEKKLSKEERELVAKLRPFARYQSAEEYDALVKGVLKAHRLRQQIEMYKVYREMGFTTLDDVVKYEAEKKQKEQEQRYRKEREGASYIFEKSHLQAGVSALGKRGSSNDNLIDEETSRGGSNARGGRGRRKSAATAADEATTAATAAGGETVATADDAAAAVSTASDNTLTDEASAFAWRSLPPLVSLDDVRQAQGGHLLADLEVQLCARIPMQPLLYLSVKQALVVEAYQAGLLTSDGVRRRVGSTFSATQADALFDFFVKEAHINQALRRHQALHPTATAAATGTTSSSAAADLAAVP